MARHDIVVIGASAGGLRALDTIFANLPANLPAAVFVVLHTTENSPGLLPQLFNRHSALPALYAVDKAPILPGRIYIAPPEPRHMLLSRGKIELVFGPRENRHRPSIDALFRSAAVAYGPRVVGVVLSGALDDGTAGLAHIKERGGTAIVQDPDDALTPSMPQSAIEDVKVDHILPAAEIAAQIVDLAEQDDTAPVSGTVNENAILKETGVCYTCPDCNGVLTEVREGSVVRYRCRVGHAYSPENLHEAQAAALEQALWAAIRSLEEHAEFSERLANRSERAERSRLAERFAEKAKAGRENAKVLRELLEQSSEELETAPEQPDDAGSAA